MSTPKFDVLICVLSNDNAFDAKDNYNVYRATEDAIKRNGCRTALLTFKEDTQINVVPEGWQNNEVVKTMPHIIQWKFPGDGLPEHNSSLTTADIESTAPPFLVSFDFNDTPAHSLYGRENELVSTYLNPNNIGGPEDIIETVMHETVKRLNHEKGAIESEEEIRSFGAALINEYVRKRVQQDTAGSSEGLINL